MPDQEVTAAEQAIARLAAGMHPGQEEVVAAIQAIPNRQEAIGPAQEFFELAEKTYEAARRLRSALVGQIWEAEEMKMAELAARVNVRPQRISQMGQAYQKAQAKEMP